MSEGEAVAEESGPDELDAGVDAPDLETEPSRALNMAIQAVIQPPQTVGACTGTPALQFG